MTIEVLKSKREAAIAKADSILKPAERAKRNLTTAETQNLNVALSEVDSLAGQISQAERGNLSTSARRSELNSLFAQAKAEYIDRGKQVLCPKTFSTNYFKAVSSLLGGGPVSASLYEGDNTSGGYAVPIELDGEIVPLAPQDIAMRQLATVVTTLRDRKLPIIDTKSTAAAKAESGGSDHSFTATSPGFTQKILRAFQAGGSVDVSLEYMQDVGIDSLQASDFADAVEEYEEPKFLTGTGTNEPEGVLTGADFGVANEDMDLDRILDHIGTLKATYHRNASFLMHRTTSIAIRKNVLTANVGGPIWTREDGQDYLYGYPAFYSASMPEIGQGNKVMVFGDFKKGYVIGDRGGSDIRVQLLDQTKFHLGIVEVLVFRRTDGRVRRSEALKTFIIDSAS